MMMQKTTIRSTATRRTGSSCATPRMGRVPLRVRAYQEDEKTTITDSNNFEKSSRKDISDELKKIDYNKSVGQNLAQLEAPAPASSEAFSAPGTWLLPTFSRRREIYAGRMAIIGFAAACAWEVLVPSHPGPMEATSIITGFSMPVVSAIFLGFVAHGILGGVLPGSPTYSPENRADVAKRPAGPPGDEVNLATEPAKFLGISRQWGFTKKNELFQGRLAMLGFLAAVVGEVKLGMGPLGQLAYWTGNQATPEWFAACANTLILWGVFSTGVAWLMGNFGELPSGDKDVY